MPITPHLVKTCSSSKTHQMRKMVTATKTRNREPMAIMATIQMLNSPSAKRQTRVININRCHTHTHTHQLVDVAWPAWRPPMEGTLGQDIVLTRVVEHADILLDRDRKLATDAIPYGGDGLFRRHLVHQFLCVRHVLQNGAMKEQRKRNEETKGRSVDYRNDWHSTGEQHGVATGAV